jgi:hypothetical protein
VLVPLAEGLSVTVRRLVRLVLRTGIEGLLVPVRRLVCLVLRTGIVGLGPRVEGLSVPVLLVVVVGFSAVQKFGRECVAVARKRWLSLFGLLCRCRRPREAPFAP